MIQIPVPDFRWGSSLMGVRMRDLLLSPPSMWAEIFWCTCLQSCLQTSTPTHKKSYTKFQNPREIFGTLVHPKSAYCTGKEGSPKYFFIGILIFLWVRSPCKISQRYDKPQPLKCHIQCFGTLQQPFFLLSAPNKLIWKVGGPFRICFLLEA